MIVEPKGKDMEARGMVLHINRNTRTTKGDFIIKRITEDNKGIPDVKDKKYPVKWKTTKLSQQSKLKIKIKKEIENFKFLCNMAILKLKAL